MSLRRGALALVAVTLVASSALAACKGAHDADPNVDAASPTSAATIAMAPTTPAEGTPAVADPAAPLGALPDPNREVPGLEFAPDSMVIGQGTTVLPGAPPPPPPPEDPFIAAIAAARVAGAACFAGQPPGEFAATIVSYVTPTGYVSRAEVEPGNVADPAVLACLRRVGTGSSFPPSPSGRTVRIDVHVRA